MRKMKFLQQIKKKNLLCVHGMSMSAAVNKKEKSQCDVFVLHL